MADYMKIVSDIVDDKADFLNALGRYLWNNPETALMEFKAHERISDFLECEGFTVQKNYILPTAFRAEFGGNIFYSYNSVFNILNIVLKFYFRLMKHIYFVYSLTKEYLLSKSS